MSRTPGRWLLAMAGGLLVLSMGGCAAQLPAYAWNNPDEALRLVNERTQHVQSLGGRGTVMLSREGDPGVVLDAVVAADRENLRLRAYKFDRAILDLTLRPDGIWLWQAPAHAKADIDLKGLARLTSGESPAKAMLWTMLMGRVPATSQIAMTDGKLIGRAGEIVTQIDPRTLTVQAYRFETQGSRAPAIRLGNYDLVDGIAWPKRISIEDATGVIDIRLAEVTLNADLPPRAFEPPKGAVRLGEAR